MEAAMIIAKIMWPVTCLISIGLLINRNWTSIILEEYSQSRIINFIVSLMRTLIWVTIITFYNIWDASVYLIISILWWILLLSGVLWLLMPEVMLAIKKYFKNNMMVFTVMLIAMFAMSVWLIFIGYIN